MAIEDRGRGKPDFFVPTVSSRPTVITEENTQERWVQNTLYSIAGFSSVTSVFYTVEDGFTLQLGAAFISSDNSVINKMRILDGSTIILGDFRYDMRGDISWSSITGQTIAGGRSIIVYLWNNDNVDSEMSLTLSGLLERNNG